MRTSLCLCWLEPQRGTGASGPCGVLALALCPLSRYPCSPQTRQLIKDGFLVELSEGSRKLRHVFLFTDVLLCAKLKKTAVG